MVCRNICLRSYSKMVVGQSHYSVGKKYCRRCECYFITERMFCECCGMRLRGSPAAREYKEKVRAKRKLITSVVWRFVYRDWRKWLRLLISIYSWDGWVWPCAIVSIDVCDKSPRGDKKIPGIEPFTFSYSIVPDWFLYYYSYYSECNLDSLP